MIRWHVLWADLKWGEPLMDGLMPIATLSPPGREDTRGSGKFPTPWSRMHAENLYAAAIDEPGDDESVVVAVGRAEPQPATSSVVPASAPASALVIMRRVVERGR